MNSPTPAIRLIPKTRTQMQAYLASMSPENRKHVSEAWLALLADAAEIDPWILGFEIANDTAAVVGNCGFKGPPDSEGLVEIAYGINPQFQGKGYAQAAARELVKYAFADRRVRLVRAHTLEKQNASATVLRKCGFAFVGQAHDPEDGKVWRWELARKPVRE
ncbi:MAG TPA: GNAT family N-acetyltransferase [Verrucomicrobiae bacterium]